MGKTIHRDKVTIRRQQLGEELHVARKKANLTLDQASKRINVSPSKLCRIERGQRPATIGEVAGLLGLYGVEGQDRDDLLSLAEDCGELGWLQRASADFRQDRNTFVLLESRAETIVDFEVTVIPGLLQTPEYARAILTESPLIAAEDVEDFLMTRLLRQSVLVRRNPPRLLALIDEPALHRPIGGPDVLRKQLEHLLVASANPRITIRVVPSAGYHVGVAGAFNILELPERTPVVYLEGLAVNLFLEESADVEVYQRALRHLLSTALDEGQSRTLIATVSKSLDTEASPDAPDQQDQPEMA